VNKAFAYIVAFILVSSYALAQSNINNYYENEFSNINFLAEFFILENNNVVLTSKMRNIVDTAIYIQPAFMYIDESGNTINSRTFLNDTMSISNTSDQSRNLLINDSLIAVLSIAWNENLSPNTFPYYLLYDFLNDSLLHVKFYNDQEWAQPWAALYHTDGFIYAVGEQYPYGQFTNRDALMLKIDLEGNVIHRKTVHRGSYDFLYGIESITDSTLLLFGANRGVNSNNYDGWILETDLDFEILSEQLIGTSATDGILTINKKEDLFVGIQFRNTFDATISDFRDVYIFHLNNTLETVWDSTYTFENELSLDDFIVEDDGVVFTANIVNRLLEDDNNFNQKSMALKMDFNGDIIWERVYYRVDDDQHRLRSVRKKPDGGYLFGGSVQLGGTVDVVSWLFTTDSVGCIDVSSYECLDGLDNYIQVWTDIPPEQAYYENQIWISPNPATNNIQIKTDIVAHKIKWAKIINLQGQLMQDLKLSQIDKPVNVQRYPAGIYLMQIKTDDGVLVERFYKN